MNKVRKALAIGGPTFIHSLDPCPKGWDYDPILSHELGELAVKTGIWPLYEVEDGMLKITGRPSRSPTGRSAAAGPRVPVEPGTIRPLHRGGHRLLPEQMDEMWEKWLIPA